MMRADDLAAGQVYRSRALPVTRAAITAFATEFDPQSFHLADDPDSLFGRQITSGWHTAAITMRLFVEAMPLEGGRVGAGVEALKWLRPVCPGDSLHVQATVLRITASRSRPGTAVLVVLIETFNQNDELVQSMQPTIILRSGAGTPP